tara:strand:- start:514 stop:1089 length:576 start_codon:yes stop_codon:yes gene_type:complete
MKEGQVSKDLKSIKNKEATELGVKDFFTSRDKKGRGSSGLVSDAEKILNEESSVKEALYLKSMEVEDMPNTIVPLFSHIFLTARRNKLVENGIYLPTASYGKGSDTDLNMDFADTQLVLATGPNVASVSVGMEVVINMENFKKRTSNNMKDRVQENFEYALPIEVVNGVEYLYLSERDLKYVSNTNGMELP